MARLVIEPVGLHWLHDAEPTDLCAHGGIRVLSDGNTVFEAGLDGDGYTLSTAALHLLRTIEKGYEPETALSGQLIPCCGNVMVVDADRGQVNNQPCPNGIEWTVQHGNGRVEVTFPDRRRLSVTADDWRNSVYRFSAAVRRFYFEKPRMPSDEFEAQWHPLFVREWDRRHASAGA